MQRVLEDAFVEHKYDLVSPTLLQYEQLRNWMRLRLGGGEYVYYAGIGDLCPDGLSAEDTIASYCTLSVLALEHGACVVPLREWAVEEGWVTKFLIRKIH